MPILKIIVNPNKILRTKSENFDLSKINTKENSLFFQNMIETMLKKDGIGLAAPQVGINSRIIVVNNKNEKIIMINPQITKKSWGKEWGEEGCLSVPNVFGKVLRHKKIKCIYFDRNGKKQEIFAKGLLARVIQHEIDHLDGILFIDKAKNIKEVAS